MKNKVNVNIAKTESAEADSVFSSFSESFSLTLLSGLA